METSSVKGHLINKTDCGLELLSFSFFFDSFLTKHVQSSEPDLAPNISSFEKLRMTKRAAVAIHASQCCIKIGLWFSRTQTSKNACFVLFTNFCGVNTSFVTISKLLM